MLWRGLGEPDYTVDIPAFLSLLQKTDGAIRSVSLNTTEYSVAQEAVRRGLVSIEQNGSADQMFRLIPTELVGREPTAYLSEHASD